MKWIKALDFSPISASQNTDPILFTWLITLHPINRNRFCFNWRTFQMSRNFYCRVTQTQMQDALKGNAFKQPFSFDFQHQFPTHSSTRFFEDSWFFFSDQLLFWNKMLPLKALNVFLNPSSPKCCLVTSNWTFFLADIKTIDCDNFCLSLSFLKLSKS